MKKLLFIIGYLFVAAAKLIAQDDNVMYAHYINVGQANAALLEFSCGAVLIDAGDQDTKTKNHLKQYLNDFFARRPDLNRTLDLVIITHDHLDHNDALDMVADNFTIKHYIDNGYDNHCKGCSGYKNQMKLQQEAGDRNIEYSTFSYEDITKNGNRSGLTNRNIDPVNCSGTDPKIILYSGRSAEQPLGWGSGDFENGNNHSYFIKVLFGGASFLFIGDGELKEMGTVVDYYNGTHALDADVLLVGHHGAKNATTYDFLKAVTPKYALISCGKWNDGIATDYKFNTYHYGHPTVLCLKMLDSMMTTLRQPMDGTVKAGLGAKNFIDVNITKRIYATPWDGDIVIRATADGRYRKL